MRDLLEYAKICMNELDAIGIKYGNVVRWEINTRAKQRWGQCRKLPDGNYVININKELLKEENSVEGLKDTIIHELLHSCEGGHGHGTIWKKYAEKVNKAYGYNIKRCSSADEKGVERNELELLNECKYILECCGCGKKFFGNRISKAIQHPENYFCKKCGGDIKRIK